MPRYLANAYTLQNIAQRTPEFWASCETAKELTQVLSEWGEPGSPVVLIEVWDTLISQENSAFVIDRRIKD